jgi:hypothetical protein
VTARLDSGKRDVSSDFKIQMFPNQHSSSSVASGVTRSFERAFRRASACLAVLLTAALPAFGAQAAAAAVPFEQSTQRITFRGVGQLGLFDPSVAEDPASGRLWMSFSAVTPSTHSKWAIGLHLAYSDDGLEWRDAGSLVKPADVIIGPLATTAPEPAIGENVRGTWQSETSALVYDASAPASERWKLLWHQVLWANNEPHYVSYSWIAMKAADAPENLGTANAVKLFSGYLAKSDGQQTIAPAFAPIDGSAAIELNRRDPQLGACVFGEPSALATPGGLYLTLDCQWLGSVPQPHTVLLRCAYPGCNVTDGDSWSVVARLTDPRDGQRLDERYKGFSATSLVEKAGKYYLLASPVASGNRYDGCNLYRFKDLAGGVLERSRDRLVIARQVHGIPDTHHGACAYHARLRNGILLSQFVYTAAPTVFQIRRSGIDVP